MSASRAADGIFASPIKPLARSAGLTNPAGARIHAFEAPIVAWYEEPRADASVLQYSVAAAARALPGGVRLVTARAGGGTSARRKAAAHATRGAAWPCFIIETAGMLRRRLRRHRGSATSPDMRRSSARSRSHRGESCGERADPDARNCASLWRPRRNEAQKGKCAFTPYFAEGLLESIVHLELAATSRPPQRYTAPSGYPSPADAISASARGDNPAPSQVGRRGRTLTWLGGIATGLNRFAAKTRRRATLALLNIYRHLCDVNRPELAMLRRKSRRLTTCCRLGAWTCAGGDDVRQASAGLLDGEPPDTHRLALVGSVFGRQFSIAKPARLLGLDRQAE